MRTLALLLTVLSSHTSFANDCGALIQLIPELAELQRKLTRSDHQWFRNDVRRILGGKSLMEALTTRQYEDLAVIFRGRARDKMNGEETTARDLLIAKTLYDRKAKELALWAQLKMAIAGDIAREFTALQSAIDYLIGKKTVYSAPSAAFQYTAYLNRRVEKAESFEEAVRILLAEEKALNFETKGKSGEDLLEFLVHDTMAEN